MEQNLQDMKISGAGSMNGGKYRDVKISGAGSVNGDIECESFDTSGASTINGNVKTGKFKVSGASEVKGSVEAEEMKISGGSEIRGDITTKYIKISGASKIKGNLRAEEVELTGSVEIKEDCEAEYFKANGGFDIGGLLNAGKIDVTIYGRCRVREIGGEKIDVRVGNGNLFSQMLKYVFTGGERLITSVIEGDDIYLEGTAAKIVRGNNVTIGPDCNIEVVEYRSTISVAADAKVNDQKKI
jgi:cytoskeletal protein CcmA (bactofilin family)